MTIGILIGLGMTIFATFIISLKGDSLKDYEGVLFFIGIAACLLFGLIGYEFDINEKINNTIKTTINTNYDNALNYHNDNDNKSFISDGSKYTFEYDEETKTLTVFTDTNSSVDAVFVDGVKQDDQKASDKTDKKKDCVSYQMDDENKSNNKVDTNNSPSTITDTTDTVLQQKIQDKIQSRYSGAVMTGFDTIKMSGTFSCNNVQYSFQWKDDMLEVINANNADDVTYYKIAQ